MVKRCKYCGKRDAWLYCLDCKKLLFKCKDKCHHHRIIRECDNCGLYETIQPKDDSFRQAIIAVIPLVFLIVLLALVCLMSGCVTVNQKTCLEYAERQECVKQHVGDYGDMAGGMVFIVPESCNCSWQEAKTKLNGWRNDFNTWPIRLGNCSVNLWKFKKEEYDDLNPFVSNVFYSFDYKNAAGNRTEQKGNMLLMNEFYIDVIINDVDNPYIKFAEGSGLNVCDKWEKRSVCIRESS